MRDLERNVELTPAERDPIDVELAVSGDSDAFERLYLRHVGRVQGLARWLMDQQDVDDLLQEIFIRVWEKLHTFKGQAAFKTWLHRLATNVILRRRAERTTHMQRYGGSDLELGQLSERHAPPGLRIDIEVAVDRLPAKAREVFVLHDMAGYKHEEIGRLLGISPGTSRSQLHHARMALRQHLAG